MIMRINEYIEEHNVNYTIFFNTEAVDTERFYGG